MTSTPAHRAPRPSRWRSAIFGLSLLVLIGAGIGLAWAGVRTVRESTAGQRFDPTTDPDEPGFEAFVDATPTMVLLHKGSGGNLVSAAVLALAAQDDGGGVLLVPGGTVVDRSSKRPRLDDVFGRGREQATVDALEELLGVGIAGSRVIDDAEWAKLVKRVAPVTVRNPDDLAFFAAGDVALEADQVAAWLELRGPGFSDANRWLRQQLFWEAWIEAVAGSDAEDVVPGEVDSGVGRFMRGIASGVSTVELLPSREQPGDERSTTVVPEPPAMTLVVAQLIPLPTASEPGARARVRLLDGADDEDVESNAIPYLTGAGAQIVIVGNAGDGFDHEVTEIRYHDPSARDAAERLQNALHVGDVIEDNRSTDYDVTIILGEDAVRALR